MSYVSLEEIMQFSLGKNPTRLKENEIAYTAEEFETDLQGCHDYKEECIINLIKSKASPLSERSVNKCITSNFLKCIFDTNALDPWYFCYQFNEGKGFEQQIVMCHQGTTLSVKKLNTSLIGKMQINLLPIEKQRIIGKIYKQTIVQTLLMQRQAENYKELTLQTLRMIEED